METALVVAEQPALPVLLEAELELGSDFARASKAKATQAAYASDFRIFEAWCHERGLSALPAAPATVCAFLAAQAGLGKRASTLGRHLDLRQPRHRRQGDATRSAPHAWTALGFGRDAMNRIQNHKEGGIGSVYERHRYSAKNQKIMEAVAADITALAAAGPTNANVSEALRRVRLSV
jgi:hypothetical protein